MKSSTRRVWNIVCALAIFTAATACNFKCGSGGDSSGTAATEGQTRVAGPFTTRPADNAVPAQPDAITHTTPQFFVAWTAPVTAGEGLTGTLIAVDTNGTAPPNTQVVQATYQATQAGQASGSFTFDMPTAGWPPGQYRVDVAKPGGALGTVSFAIQ